MNNTLWTNTIWYIALFATSAIGLIVIFIKASERKKTFVFYFAVLGFTYCIEIALLLLLNAYTYFPMIAEEKFFDAVLGNIFSQISVSSSAVLICVLGLSNWWLLAFSIIYFLVDLLFSRLGIYVHYWYRSIYTLAGFFIYGALIKAWYKRLFNSPPKIIYYLSLLLSVFAITANLLGTALKLLNIRIFQSSFYPDPSKNHTATALIYLFVLIIIIIALYKWKAKWSIKGIVFLLLFVCQFGLVHSGIMVVKSGLWPLVLNLDLIGFYVATAVMDRSLYTTKKARIT